MAKEQELFDKHVGKFTQWLMKKSLRFTKWLNYEIGTVDNNPDKMILTRRKKVIAKTF
jgi:hypothetical protein